MDILAIEKAKQQWQSAADSMPQLICLMNEEGRLLHINRTLEWWGLGAVSDARGRELHDLLHPGCNDPKCYFKRLWRASTPARRDGRRSEHEAFDALLNRHFVIRIQPLLSRNPEQSHSRADLHSVVIVDDVSDLKQAEAAIRRHNEELTQQVANEAERRALSEDMQARLLAILEQTSDYVAMADASESMLYINPAGRSMLGLGPAADITHKRLCDHTDRETQQMIRNVAIPAAIEKGLWAGETKMRDRSGREIHASQVVIAHRKEDGQVDSISTILRDITERVESEQALRESREELRQLSGMLVSIQEDERRRIALDLHDGLGQSLSLIKLGVENAAALLAAEETQGALEVLNHLIPQLKSALHDVRRVATELRPSILDDLGIMPTLSWFFREFEAVCGQISVEKTLSVTERQVPAALKITIYRIIQEATSNILKHAAADRMRVALYCDDEALHLQIEDNGRGFAPDRLCKRCQTCSTDACSGLGLVGMKERVSLSGGSYRLDSSPGFGTRIEATWPIAVRPEQRGSPAAFT
ncbi:MAG: PAS domain S-box protein [Thiobacillaceae bacterium]|jgi:PAS domain S-box-containing protein|nr:PAS domain S-box protein [Thiobacillaceae bacterium]